VLNGSEIIQKCHRIELNPITCIISKYDIYHNKTAVIMKKREFNDLRRGKYEKVMGPGYESH